MEISNCCNATEWLSESDICGDCKEHALFYNEDELAELEEYIGKPILFTYGERDEREDFTFVGKFVDVDYEGILLWDDDHCYVTLEYAKKNLIKDKNN